MMKKQREEVEKKGLKLSVSEYEKEEKSKMIVSCRFLEDELRDCSKEGVTMAESVETLGVDLITRVKRLGLRERARRKKCKVRFSLMKKNKAFQKNYMKVGVKKLLRAGMVSARTWRVHAAGKAPTERFKLRRQMTAAAGKKGTTSLSLFMEGGRSLYFGHSVFGRSSMYWKMANRTKRSMKDANSEGSDMETGERSSRSGDVRDP